MNSIGCINAIRLKKQIDHQNIQLKISDKWAKIMKLFTSMKQNINIMRKVIFFSFSQGTLIIPNLTSALSEEGKWKNARGFHPCNFLNELGEFEKPEAFMPFSVGKMAYGI